MIKIHHKTPVPTHGDCREFSKEIHGEGYKDIAASYINRYGHNVDHVEGLEDFDSAPKVRAIEDSPLSRDALKAKAKACGLEFFPNIKTTALAELVANHEESLK